jgi:hypothetical protein
VLGSSFELNAQWHESVMIAQSVKPRPAPGQSGTASATADATRRLVSDASTSPALGYFVVPVFTDPEAEPVAEPLVVEPLSELTGVPPSATSA